MTMTITTNLLLTLLRTATDGEPTLEPNVVERSLLTDGPTVTLHHADTDRALTIGYEPSTGNTRIWLGDDGRIASSIIGQMSVERAFEYLLHLAPAWASPYRTERPVSPLLCGTIL